MKKIISVALIWITLLAGLSYWIYRQEMEFARDMIHNEALTHLARDKAFRYWASNHGGVYVPVTEKLQPSPYLAHIANRDLLSTEGLELTLMNPAWMLRQLMTEYEELYGVKGHITSLDPLRKENAPDEWEIQALKAFEDGESEVSEFSRIDDSEFYRLMTPLVTIERCLKCHAHQGYEVGDVRGGVSVSISTEPYYEAAGIVIRKNLQSFFIIGFVGLAAIIVFFRVLQIRENQRLEAQLELEKIEDLMVQEDKMATVDNLSAGIAHEINNPLAGMIQATSVLASRFITHINSSDSMKVANREGLDVEAVERFLENRGFMDMIHVIEEGGHRIADLIQSLTVFTSFHSENETVKKPEFYINNALMMIEEYFIKSAYDASSVQVILEIEEESSLINGDRLQQCLYNIILNSYQNLLENSVSNPEIRISLNAGRAMQSPILTFRIIDNGTGIDHEKLKRVLDPFFTTREVGQGKGLGLSVAYYIVTKAYKGNMTIQSEGDSGTVVEIQIPSRS